jgi:Flp pilus assembly protein TadG
MRMRKHLTERTSEQARIAAPDAAPMATTEKTPGRQRGQALVEFTLILPVFFLLVAGMVDFGLGVYSDLTLVNAAREGARLGVIDPGDTTAIEERVRAMSGGLDGSKLNVTIACERATGGSFAACTDPQWQPGDATRVTVDYEYTMFFPLLFGTEIPLSSEAKMRIE